MNEYLVLPYWVVVILSVIEGLTEFLPVSSTGHLIVAGAVLGFDDARTHTFEIWIQLGAIFAVVIHSRHRLLGFIKDNKDGFSGIEGILKLAVACFPALLAGFVLHKIIKSFLMAPWCVAVGFMVGGALLLWGDRQTKKSAAGDLGELSVGQCLTIGLFQCLALWPGMSRSGSTIIGALFVGASRQVAAEFSFLVAIPIMFAATAYDMWKSAGELSMSDALPFGLGFIVSFVVAFFALKAFVGYISKHSLAVFGWYRIGFLALMFLWFATK